ncbi:MAG: hypothetical protein QE159_05955 [Candidatus Verstraetearchaeota archaeon]|nr:hypothetical protein [Candidatus Verstraetearchaeota archaeon]
MVNWIVETILVLSDNAPQAYRNIIVSTNLDKMGILSVMRLLMF